MKITDIFEDEEINSLNSLVRWNGIMRIKDETVAHHLFLSGMFGSILVKSLFKGTLENIVNLRLQLKFLEAVKFHDFDEMYGGDVLYTLKYNRYNGEAMRELIDEFVQRSTEDKFNKPFDDVDVIIREQLIGQAYSGQKEVVKVCDWLACVYYLNNEEKLGNTFVVKYKMKALDKMREACARAIAVLEKHYGKNVFNFEAFYEIIDYCSKLLKDE